MVGLAPGSYVVTPTLVQLNGFTFASQATRETRVLVAGGTSTLALNFAPVDAQLNLAMTGLPDGAAGSVTISSPNGYAQQMSAAGLLSGLTPGSYTISAVTVSIGSRNFGPSAATQTLTLSAGAMSSANVQYVELLPPPPTTGALTVNIPGLPAGATAGVVVSGPNGFRQLLGGPQALLGLAPGEYQIVATNVNANGFAYAPAIASQLRTVVAGSAVVATVDYGAIDGALTIAITGLPTGGNPDAVVSGPSGYAHALSTSETLGGLVPGTYSLTLSNVTISGVTYAPVSATFIRSVTAGTTATVTGVYAALVPPPPTVGSLSVSIDGTPIGTTANLTITGPNGYVRSLATAQTLNGLAPGVYVVTPANISANGFAYSAPSLSPTVVTGTVVNASVVYVPIDGAIAVSVTGLPVGASASITMSNATGYSHLLAGPETISGLLPGGYDLAVGSVSSGGVTFVPTTGTGAIAVLPGALASVTVTYVAVVPPPPTVGSLVLGIAGVPVGATANVTVAGPNGFVQALGAPQTLSGLAPGSYTITAATFSAAGFVYGAQPSTQTAVVTAGTAATATVSYGAITGALNVTMSGLPSGTSANVTVTGPGGVSQQLTTAQLVSGLSPGTYSVNASDVVNGAVTYRPVIPAQSVNVLVGATSSIGVTYAVQGSTANFPPLTPGYHVRSMVVNGMSLNYQIFVPAGYNPAVTTPVILFAHGSGEIGNNNVQQLSVGLGPYVTANASTFPAVVIFPQQPASGVPSGAAGIAWIHTFYMTALDSTLRQVNADSSRIYMTGVSLGGFRTWGIAYEHPTLFAAIAPISGGLTPLEYGVTTSPLAISVPQSAALVAPRLRDMPIWMWHGDADGVVPIALNAYTIRDAFALFGPPATFHLIVAPGRGHELEVNYFDPAFWAWLFAQHR
jgi:poly(3-hydroxybutyrate) depolymerase